MAGFQVTLHGRFWVITEDSGLGVNCWLDNLLEVTVQERFNLVLSGEFSVIQNGLLPRRLVDRKDCHIALIPKRDTSKGGLCFYPDFCFAAHFIQRRESVDSQY
jgi:hypothetical protein